MTLRELKVTDESQYLALLKTTNMHLGRADNIVDVAREEEALKWYLENGSYRLSQEVQIEYIKLLKNLKNRRAAAFSVEDFRYVLASFMILSSLIHLRNIPQIIVDRIRQCTARGPNDF